MVLFPTDPPRHLQLIPEQSYYHPGDFIVCSADGNPPPNISWMNNANNHIIENDTLPITEDMIGTVQSFDCIAINEVKGEQKKASRTIKFSVFGECCL